MRYENIVRGKFIKRENRFVAKVELHKNGGTREETVHVKNTGRCEELLLEGAQVWLSENFSQGRKTAYDLVTVNKGGRLVNIDANASNTVVKEWLESGAFMKNITTIKPEFTWGSSRFDFYLEAGERRILLEVKSVTLEDQARALFPDAPSRRAVKHVNELTAALQEGYESYILFVIQMEGVLYFEPNRRAQPEFADALIKARQAGVHVLAWDCTVVKDGLRLNRQVPVVLEYQTDLLACIVRPLLAWYDSNRRILPWREEPSPYRVWLSEVMLQQTRVEAVKPYFERFLASVPDIPSLAAVREDTLLKLWEGLGYYNRARNLQKAAIQIMEDYGGRMPGTFEELQKLKGIGDYTAGAIASIAFGQPVPAVDGNVLRVISRLTKDEGDILNQAVKNDMRRRLLAVMPMERPGDFNQALMELGATVCLPNAAPRCDVCPWERLCLARRDHTQMEYPKKSARKERKVEYKTVFLIGDVQRVAIRKRPDKGLLAGMYEFPSVEGNIDTKEALFFLETLGIRAVRIKPLPSSKHIFTHKEWHMTGYAVLTDVLEPVGKQSGLLFIKPEETREEYPIPSAFGAFTEYLDILTGSKRLKAERLKEKKEEND